MRVSTFQKIINFLAVNLLAVICVGIAIYVQIAGKEEVNRVIFFDVGQGDSALIQSDGYNILIDTGANRDVVYKLGEYLSIGESKIDMLVTTHEHADHNGGVDSLCESYYVENIVSLNETLEGLYLSCENSDGVQSQNLNLSDDPYEINIGQCILQIIKPIANDEASDNDSIII